MAEVKLKLNNTEIYDTDLCDENCGCDKCGKCNLCMVEHPSLDSEGKICGGCGCDVCWRCLALVWIQDAGGICRECYDYKCVMDLGEWFGEEDAPERICGAH